MIDLLIEAYKKHNVWVEMVKSFGCNRDTAQDIVSEMYIILSKKQAEGKNIEYNNTVNDIYVYKVLKSLFIDLKRKEGRVSFVDTEILHNHLLNSKNQDFNDAMPIDYAELYDKVIESLNELYWYDRKVFELLDGQISVSELSRNTGISYYSLYNTYKQVKKHLKDKLL